MTPREFLDSGLLFQVNRQILHPLGLYMSVTVLDDGDCVINQILEESSDDDGFHFDTAMLAEGIAKLKTYYQNPDVRRRAKARLLYMPRTGGVQQEDFEMNEKKG